MCVYFEAKINPHMSFGAKKALSATCHTSMFNLKNLLHRGKIC